MPIYQEGSILNESTFQAGQIILLSFCRNTDIMILSEIEVMKMTIGDLLEERGLSRYRLSKVSGIPWATLSDICSGKTKMNRCSAETLLKLSKALGISMEELLLLETVRLH